MSCTEILKVRVSPALKSEVQSLVERELLTKASWLKRIVVKELRSVTLATPSKSTDVSSDRMRVPKASNDASVGAKTVYVRFRYEDRLLLEARSAARGMRSATYVSVLTRAHLRALTPLPSDEFLALKRSIAELAAVGRNLNQLARIANEDGRLPGSVREEFRAMLKICEALRDSVKELLKANVTSWTAGHV